MSYCADADLDLAFGKSNVDKWADVNSTALQADIDARRSWARGEAYDELNSRLATSQYQLPLGGTTYPPILVRMEAYLAGVLLYESRGVTDVDEKGRAQHQLMWHRKRVDEFVRDVHARRTVLQGATLATGAVPAAGVTQTAQFVRFPDPSPARRLTELEDDMIEVRRRGGD